ncbi:MAG: hypothetical protein M0R06_24630 [Sphaerochaeta sp.]|jgi:hypothetical protein|nr:hypothetical protein [Sphaerochaeta sp.]
MNMGTNYYICCKSCGSREVHIGKMSIGNPFLSCFDGLDALKAKLADMNEGGDKFEVRNEYNEAISPEDLWDWIDKRTGRDEKLLGWTYTDDDGDWS